MAPICSPGLTEKTRANVAAVLARALQQELTLSHATRRFYASVPTFHSLHKLFADQYRQLERWLAQLSRQAVVPRATAMTSSAAESGRCPLEEKAMVGELLVRHEQLARQLQDDLQMCSTERSAHEAVEVLRDLVDFHETAAWMLRMIQQGSAWTPANRG